MRIYHYTTLGTLALILKSKAIRFNRLDNMDDLQEGSVKSNGMRLGQYVFVSCWTEDEKEAIPMWHLYTKKGCGVRLSMDCDMFPDYEGTSVKLGDLTLSLKGKSKIPIDNIANMEYFVAPAFMNNSFYRKVVYVDDVSEMVQSAYKNDGLGITLRTGDIGTYKNRIWQFQNESRFVINIFPWTNGHFDVSANHRGFHPVDLQTNAELPIKEYDLPLKENVFEELEITMSPDFSYANEILLNSLVKEYAPKALVKESELKGMVVFK